MNAQRHTFYQNDDRDVHDHRQAHQVSFLIYYMYIFHSQWRIINFSFFFTEIGFKGCRPVHRIWQTWQQIRHYRIYPIHTLRKLQGTTKSSQVSVSVQSASECVCGLKVLTPSPSSLSVVHISFVTNIDLSHDNVLLSVRWPIVNFK